MICLICACLWISSPNKDGNNNISKPSFLWKLFQWMFIKNTVTTIIDININKVSGCRLIRLNWGRASRPGGGNEMDTGAVPPTEYI